MIICCVFPGIQQYLATPKDFLIYIVMVTSDWTLRLSIITVLLHIQK